MAGDYSNIFDLKAELAILESRLEFPNKETLRPYLVKLLENPGSMVFLALEAPCGPQAPVFGKGWFSSEERYALRNALEKVNARRKKVGQKLTSEQP
jgi:hypothetical protein